MPDKHTPFSDPTVHAVPSGTAGCEVEQDAPAQLSVVHGLLSLQLAHTLEFAPHCAALVEVMHEDEP